MCCFYCCTETTSTLHFFSSGCSYSLTHPGMRLSNNFCLMQTPGCVKEEVVLCTHRNTQVHWYNLPLTGTITHRGWRGGAVSEYRWRDALRPCFQTHPPAVHHQWPGLGPHAGTGQHPTPRWDFPGALGLRLKISEKDLAGFVCSMPQLVLRWSIVVWGWD